MRAINGSDCIIVDKFVMKQITNPPPKDVRQEDPFWRNHGEYYEFMAALSKGKNVRCLYLPEVDMIEYMKIISESQSLNYDILWYLDSYMNSLANYQKYDDLLKMMGASFDIQDFIKRRLRNFYRMVPTSRWETGVLGFLSLSKQALVYLDRTDLNKTVETLDKH